MPDGRSVKRIWVSRWLHTLVLLTLLAGAVGVRIQDVGWAQSLRNLAFDGYNRLRPRPLTNKIAIVDIDEESLARSDLGQWPWPRTILATMVNHLEAMGAKAVVFDMVFAEPDRTSPQAMLNRLPDLRGRSEIAAVLKKLPDNDDIFARAIRQAGNVVTGFIWSSDKNAALKMPVLSQPILLAPRARVIQSSVPRAAGAAITMPFLAEAGAGDGGFGVTPEVDGIIRRVPLLFGFNAPKSNDQILYPSLALEAIRVAQGRKTVAQIRLLKPQEAGLFDPPFLMRIGAYSVPLDRDGRLFAYFSPERHDAYIPAWKIIDGSADPRSISGKIVFVGTSAEGLEDLRSTPLDLFIPGVEVHVNIAEQILTENFLRRPQLIEGGELLCTAALGLAVIFLTPFIGALSMTLIAAGLVAGIALLSWLAFTLYGILLDPVYPSLCIVVLTGASSLLSYIRAEAERVRVREAFSLYISPDYMAELTRDPGKLHLGGETRELTVMFTDIRNFTGVAEGMPPSELIRLMNDFLTPMSDLVMSNRGTIDKYIGDAMMAFWNAPLDDPNHARHACTAALQMRAALAPVNERLRQRGQNASLLLRAGIGIHTGPASVGNMGSEQRFAYSAIGDTVNMASRLESQTKTYGVPIIVSDDTRKQVPDFAVLELDLLRVKGRVNGIRIFTVLGDEKVAGLNDFRAWQSVHDEMLAAYYNGHFGDAQKLLATACDASSANLEAYYALFGERIRALIEQPPPADWNGIFTAVEK